MLGNGHAGFGGRPRETDQPKGWHRALGRPHLRDDPNPSGAVDPVAFYRSKHLVLGHK